MNEEKKISGLMHDLGNVLNIVCNGIDLVFQDESLRLRQNESFSRIASANILLRQIYQELKFALSHSEASRKFTAVKLCDRYQVVRDLLVNFKDIYKINLRVENKTSENCYIYANYDLLDQISRNVIENAAKSNASKVIVQYVENDYTVDIHYKDDGDGLNKDELEKIGFGYTTGGGGKGVEIIRDLVHEAGGVVNFQSIKDVGTDMIISLRKVKT